MLWDIWNPWQRGTRTTLAIVTIFWKHLFTVVHKLTIYKYKQLHFHNKACIFHFVIKHIWWNFEDSTEHLCIPLVFFSSERPDLLSWHPRMAMNSTQPYENRQVVEASGDWCPMISRSDCQFRHIRARVEHLSIFHRHRVNVEIQLYTTLACSL